MSLDEAVRDISLQDFADWGDAERICVNVNALYREFAGDQGRPDVMKLFAMMGRYHAEHGHKH